MSEDNIASIDPVDAYAGNVIRARRKLAGVSQQALGTAIGVSFQQVQKYERGTNRVSASVLHRIATFLNAPVGDFFPIEDGQERVGGLGPIDELAATDGGLRLARAWSGMDRVRRVALLNVALVLADDADPTPAAGDEAEVLRRVS